MAVTLIWYCLHDRPSYHPYSLDIIPPSTQTVNGNDEKIYFEERSRNKIMKRGQPFFSVSFVCPSSSAPVTNELASWPFHRSQNKRIWKKYWVLDATMCKSRGWFGSQSHFYFVYRLISKRDGIFHFRNSRLNFEHLLLKSFRTLFRYVGHWRRAPLVAPLPTYYFVHYY